MFKSFGAKALSFEQPHSAAPTPLDDARELIRRYPN